MLQQREGPFGFAHGYTSPSPIQSEDGVIKPPLQERGRRAEKQQADPSPPFAKRDRVRDDTRAQHAAPRERKRGSSRQGRDANAAKDPPLQREGRNGSEDPPLQREGRAELAGGEGIEGAHKTKSQRAGHPEPSQPFRDAPPSVYQACARSAGCLSQSAKRVSASRAPSSGRSVRSLSSTP